MRILRPVFIISLLLAAPHLFACPGCKESVTQNGPSWANAFGWSILFMLGAVMSMFGGVAYLIFRVARRESPVAGKDAAAVHASKGHWLKITLPICCMIFVILFTVDSHGTASDKQQALADQSFLSILAAFPKILVIVRADGCNACKEMDPVLETVSRDPNIQLITVDYDNKKNIALRLQASEFPTFIAFKDGTEMARRAGACTEQELRQWLEETMNN